MTQRTVPLAGHTSFRLGGHAGRFCVVASEDELSRVLKSVSGHPLYVLGQGSNLLVNDGPLPRLVIANRISGIDTHEHGAGVLIRAGGGVDWDGLVSLAVSRGLQGIECLSGIPGTVGAAPVQNIGAYGQSIADVLHSVSAVDMDSGEPLELSASECAFAYRSSIFQRRRLFITRVNLLLRPRAPALVKYQDLAAKFGTRQPSLAQIRRAVLEIRGAKGALLMDGWPQLRSAGSFFRNPVVPQATFTVLLSELEHGDAVRKWFWLQPDGTVKLGAGRIIEHLFARGSRFGPVGISPHHALTLVAYDGARAADVVGLARRIQESVMRRFGVILEPEPVLWGWDEYPLLRRAD